MITIRKCRWGDKEQRVLHAPSVVGGNATTLSQSLNQIGCPSISVAYEDHRFTYKPDVLLWKSEYGLLKKEAIRIISVVRAALGYEVIHFNFGTTMAMPSLPLRSNVSSFRIRMIREIHFHFTELLQIAEVVLLQLLKRRVVITYQGDDARQGDVSREIFEESIANHVGCEYYSERTDQIKRRRIRRLSRLVSSTHFVNPDLANFLPPNSKFIPYCHTEVHGKSIENDNHDSKRFHIIHAPSHQAAKGSDVIIQVVNELQAAGLPIDFALVENVSHSEIGDLLLSADLLIDQLYAGWYGGIAIEALCRGVPVMTYMRSSDFLVVPPSMVQDLPIISVDKASLKESIVKFINFDDETQRSLRVAGIHFSTKWHNPQAIAEQLVLQYFPKI